MVVLDTDHITILVEHESTDAHRRLTRRLDELPPEQVASTIVTYEEQSRGWLGYVARVKTVGALVEAYRRLELH